MSPEQFYQSRQANWQQLSNHLDRLQGSIGRLTPEQVREIGRLYRTTTSDLAVAQRDYPDHNITRYLNQLSARAHALIYRSDPFSLQQARRFFTHVIPQTFRETSAFFVVALLLLFLPSFATGIATALYPETARVLLPAQMQGVIQNIEDGVAWFDDIQGQNVETSAFITTNNIQVSFNAFAGGMTAGLLTVYVLIFNGMMLGSLIGLSIHHDFGWRLGNFVVGHGVIELSMICLAGAAGLMFAWAIIQPRPYTRRDAIMLAGRKALVLIVTCALFLVVAGLIEGFISPNLGIPPWIKWFVGWGSGAVMYGYFLLSGRESH